MTSFIRIGPQGFYFARDREISLFRKRNRIQPRVGIGIKFYSVLCSVNKMEIMRKKSRWWNFRDASWGIYHAEDHAKWRLTNSLTDFYAIWSPRQYTINAFYFRGVEEKEPSCQRMRANAIKKTNTQLEWWFGRRFKCLATSTRFISHKLLFKMLLHRQDVAKGCYRVWRRHFQAFLW